MPTKNISKFIQNADEVFSPIMLIRLRWIMLLLVTSVLLIFVEFKSISLNQFYKALAILVGLIIFNNFQYDSFKKERNLILSNFWQILIDLVSISSVVYICGGNRNPFVVLIVLIVLIAPLFLNILNGGLILLLTLISMYFQTKSHAVFWHTANYTELNPMFLGVMAIIIWLLMTWLSFILKSTRDYMEEMMKREMRVNRLHAVGALTSGFCHELGTPLGTIRMRIDRLVEGRGGEKDLSVIDESVTRIEEKLQGLIDQSETDDQLTFNRVNLNDVIHEASSKFDNISFDNLDFVVVGSKLSLVRMFYDIFNNCFQAGATEVSVKVYQDDNLNIVIKDNGPGFPKVVLDNFGSPFNSTKEKGMGIGIYNALSYMELLGGSMKIENNSGAQVTFSFKMDM